MAVVLELGTGAGPLVDELPVLAAVECFAVPRLSCCCRAVAEGGGGVDLEAATHC